MDENPNFTRPIADLMNKRAELLKRTDADLLDESEFQIFRTELWKFEIAIVEAEVADEDDIALKLQFLSELAFEAFERGVPDTGAPQHVIKIAKEWAGINQDIFDAALSELKGSQVLHHPEDAS